MDSSKNKEFQAYIIGVALGDGNLSIPNGRVTRLRITCDAKYKKINAEMFGSVKLLFPKNKVAIVPRDKHTHFDISVYSNALSSLLPWKAGRGPKEGQRARVPEWIFEDTTFMKHCLLGLLQTDGSVYRDRGYLMVNFCNNIRELAEDVFVMISMLGFRPSFHTTPVGTKTKYTVRVARYTQEFIKTINLQKS